MNPNRHQKALNWLLFDMEFEKRYALAGSKREILLDIFLGDIHLPTKPMKEYNYYFDLSANFTHIIKKISS